jgi:hypothetical protein
MESGHVAMILYVATGMLTVGGGVLSVNAVRTRRRRPSAARHRAVGRAGAGAAFVPAPRAAVDDTVTMPYPVWPGDPVRTTWVDAPGRTAGRTISLRDWYEDPYAGNVTEPHDPWRAMYESVAKLRHPEDLPST